MAMPELPEVETVCKGLNQIIGRGLAIDEVRLHRKDLRKPFPKLLNSKLKGLRLEAVRRRAKYLLLDCGPYVLINHLGMTGSWRLEKGSESELHDHFEIRTSKGRLIYNDPRRFGLLLIENKGEEYLNPFLSHLGVEPLEGDFSAQKLFQQSRGKVSAVKVFIMDQKIVVGVGNIYAAEALFRSGLRPQKQAGKLSKKDCENLVGSIQEVLREALSSGGSTIRSYRSASGEAGAFQNQLFVYGRAGESCRVCGSKVRTEIQAQRSSYWCPKCQR